MANKPNAEQDQLVSLYPTQMDPYRVRGGDFPNKGGSGPGSKPGFNELCPESGNQVGPRNVEDGGMGESGAGTPTEWNSGGRSPKVASNFPTAKNKGEGSEAATSMSIPEGVDLISGKLSSSTYKETAVHEVPQSNVSLGRH